MTATRHRLWDQRGQTLPVALLAAIGVLIPLFVGGWGLAQWLSVRARAQAAADAARWPQRRWRSLWSTWR